MEGDLGRYLMRLDREMLDAKLPGLFGFHLMQLGIGRMPALCESSIIRHKFLLGSIPGQAGVSAVAQAEQMPVESDSIDVLLLHHVLEFSRQPHQLLREAARVIVPHGHLLIAGFNPFSALGLRSLLWHRLGHEIWRGRLFGRRRIIDWLALLDFAVEDVQYRFHGLPVDHEGLLRRLAPIDRLAARWSLPGGGLYLIHARKQVSCMTPVKDRPWRARPRLAAVPLAPTTRIGES